MKTARVITSGGGQTVRLPDEYRSDTDVVYVRKDERTGDIVLSERPGLADLFDAIDTEGDAADWRLERGNEELPSRAAFDE